MFWWLINLLTAGLCSMGWRSSLPNCELYSRSRWSDWLQRSRFPWTNSQYAGLSKGGKFVCVFLSFSFLFFKKTLSTERCIETMFHLLKYLPFLFITLLLIKIWSPLSTWSTQVSAFATVIIAFVFKCWSLLAFISTEKWYQERSLKRF